MSFKLEKTFISAILVECVFLKNASGGNNYGFCPTVFECCRGTK